MLTHSATWSWDEFRLGPRCATVHRLIAVHAWDGMSPWVRP